MKKLLLAILSGFLLAYSWPEIGFFPFIFIAFIPLLILEEEISNSSNYRSWQIFGFSFLTFLTFNFLTTYWVLHATISGAIAAFLINAILMSLPFLFFHKIKKFFGKSRSYFALIFFWISIEYLHLHWELAWPWLTLGNVFAKNPDVVQWYEYTGILGGSVWVLLLNILCFFFWKSNRNRKYLYVVLIVLSLLIPGAISLFLTREYNEDYIEVVIVQPNKHHFIDESGNWQKENIYIDSLIISIKKVLTDYTDLVIAPESVWEENIWEHQIEASSLSQMQDAFPDVNILVGATTSKYYGDIRKTQTARFHSGGFWWDAFNSAVFLSSDSAIDNPLIYHKIKLVPGAEQIPYSSILNLFGDFTVDLGGISGSMGRDNTIFTFPLNQIKVQPLICYESIFGEMIKGNQSNILAIITDDGWWKNTPGYKQHFHYSRLRAIEQRKSVVRSANTGISGLIYPNGEVSDHTLWNEEKVIKVFAPITYENTFYNRYGDYLGRICSFVAILLILIIFVKSRLKKIPPS